MRNALSIHKTFCHITASSGLYNLIRIYSYKQFFIFIFFSVFFILFTGFFPHFTIHQIKEHKNFFGRNLKELSFRINSNSILFKKLMKCFFFLIRITDLFSKLYFVRRRRSPSIRDISFFQSNIGSSHSHTNL